MSVLARMHRHGPSAHTRMPDMYTHSDVPTTMFSVILAHMSMHSLHMCEDILTGRVPGECTHIHYM